MTTKPLRVDGRVVVQVRFRPAVPEFLPAAWVATILGWHRGDQDLGEGRTADEAVDALLAQTKHTRNDVRIDVTPCFFVEARGGTDGELREKLEPFSDREEAENAAEELRAKYDSRTVVRVRERAP